MLKRVMVAGIAAAGLATIGAGAAYAATADPVPTATGLAPAAAPTAPPVTITPTVPPPVVNPFGGCRFTWTDEVTFVPQLGVFRAVPEPSITCVRRGRVLVYVLQR